MEQYATYKQVNYIKELLERLGRDPDNYNLVGLTKEEASEMIDDLKRELEE